MPTKDSTALTEPPDAEIEEAILAALPASGELVDWCPLRDRLPGRFWAKCRVMVRLFESDQIVILILRWRGRDWVGVADAEDRELAAAIRAKGRAPEVRVA